mmetsp:Transcript_27172/g.24052  ORF Transcript_27172/g.24052 Transcript_27172/m.24052 type:complete len:124 (-) Transcript_27172:13-384(-)
MLEASWVLLNCTQKVNEKTIDLLIKHDILEVFEQKIELENLTEQHEEVILTFVEEFLKKTMRFKAHQEIKLFLRSSNIMDFIKKHGLKKYESPNGLKSFNILAKYFKDIRDEIQSSFDTKPKL